MTEVQDAGRPSEIRAIDVHAHYGTMRREGATLLCELTSGGVGTVVARARLANTRLTIVSPLRALMPRGAGDPVTANEEALRDVSETDALLQWVVVDPLKPDTYRQAQEMLASEKCAGIKIHPEEHCYPISEHGDAIFEFAAAHGAVVQTHSGGENSMPMDFVPFADEYPEMTLIVSHLGHCWNDDLSQQVRAVQAAKHGNIFTDTSSAKSITSGLHEWALSEIGADRILYGTDSPLYFAPMQRARIDNAGIEYADKEKILCRTAEKLFGL